MSSGHNPVSGLKCVCLNARSIVNKMGELRLMVEDVEPDITGITETWTRPDWRSTEQIRRILQRSQLPTNFYSIYIGFAVALYTTGSCNQTKQITNRTG